MNETSRSKNGSASRVFGEKNIALLHALIHACPKLRRVLIQHANNDLIRCICECALNLLHGNIRLKDCEKAKLRKHKKLLRKLADKKQNLSTKRKTINQKGGAILPILLAPLISALISAIV